MNRENAPRLGEIGEVSEKEWRNEIAGILIEVADRIKSFEEEAKEALRARDVATYEAKLREKGRELVELPTRVGMLVANLDRETERELMRSIDFFSTQAQEALSEKDVDVQSILLTSLLVRKGSQIGDRNMLEQLVDELKEE